MTMMRVVLFVLLILLVFIPFTVYADELVTDCPVDGVYQSTGHCIVDGIEYNETDLPYLVSRIGVSFKDKVIYFTSDLQSMDGNLLNEEVETYEAIFYTNCITWDTDQAGFKNAVFAYYPEYDIWRLFYMGVQASLIMDFVLIELW